MKIILTANTDWYLFNFKRLLIESLAANGNEVVLVSPPGKYSVQLSDLGFRHIPWNVGRKSLTPWKEWQSTQEIERIYRQEKPDLVQHFTVKPVLYGSLAAFREHTGPICNAITGRGYLLESTDQIARWLRPFIMRQYKKVFSYPNQKVIFETPADQAYFIENGFLTREKTRLIEGVGVDEQRFYPVPEPEGLPIISFVGRLLESKGLDTLIDAVRILKQSRMIRVILAGDYDPGNPTSIPPETIQAWINEGLVEWQGWQTDVKKVYDQSNVVVLPSLTEGVPTVLLEAAACGRAIVASDIPGCRIVVEDGINGIIFPVNDSKALVNAIEYLLDHPEERQAMGDAGRDRVLRQFTATHIIQATLDVYNELLGTNWKI